jgi:hypothetical protein
MEVIEHPLHEAHATPGGDFLVGKPELKSHTPSVQKKCSDLPFKFTPEP